MEINFKKVICYNCNLINLKQNYFSIFGIKLEGDVCSLSIVFRWNSNRIKILIFSYVKNILVKVFSITFKI